MEVEQPPMPAGNLLPLDSNAGMRVAVFSGLLFFSGIGALIFETLWLRLSGLAFGNSVWAAALILSSFMAGLALGNAVAASSKIRRWRPLHLYAVLEILVAFFGCTIVFGLPLLGAWLRPLWQILWNFQPTLLALRFVVSFAILLVPTTAMGLTLPVLIEDPVLRRSDFARDRFSLWLEHIRRGGRSAARRRLSGRGVWTSRHQCGRGAGELRGRSNGSGGDES
jgi:spermidine synthase